MACRDPPGQGCNDDNDTPWKVGVGSGVAILAALILLILLIVYKGKRARRHRADGLDETHMAEIGEIDDRAASAEVWERDIAQRTVSRRQTSTSGHAPSKLEVERKAEAAAAASSGQAYTAPTSSKAGDEGDDNPPPTFEQATATNHNLVREVAATDGTPGVDGTANPPPASAQAPSVSQPANGDATAPSPHNEEHSIPQSTVR